MVSVTNRFDLLAKPYDRDVLNLVPKYMEIQELVVQLINFHFDVNTPLKILDLGAGSGILVERLIRTFPDCTCYWVDCSESMLELAQARLKAYKNRVNFEVVNLNYPELLPELPEGFDVIVSNHTIHHLPHEGKQQLYKWIYGGLKQQGLFINADEIMANNPQVQEMYLKYWDEFVLNQCKRGQLTSNMKCRWQEWRKQYIEKFSETGCLSEDYWARLDEQLNWLAEIGFKEVECFWKYYLWAVFGGKKVS